MLSTLLAGIYNLGVLIFYFFYYLFKGKPEWQGDNGRICNKRLSKCCLHGSENVTSDDGCITSKRIAEDVPNAWKNFHDPPRPRDLPENEIRRNISSAERQYFQKIANLLRIFRAYLKRFVEVICIVIKEIFYWLSWLWHRHRDRIEEFSTIKRQEYFVQKSLEEDSTLIHNGETSDKWAKECNSNQGECTEAFAQSSVLLFPEERPAMEHGETAKKLGDEFHSTKCRLNGSYMPDIRTQVQRGEPLASSLMQPSWITTPCTQTGLIPKGGVPLFPPEVLAATHAYLKEKELKTTEESENWSCDDWTVSSRVKILDDARSMANVTTTDCSTQDKTAEEEDEYWMPSVKPVVSKLAESSGDTAEFIFRAPRPSSLPSPIQQPENGFLMGRSVFSPIKEAEELRSSINRRMTSTPESHISSSVISPYDEQFSSRNTFYESKNVDRNSQSSLVEYRHSPTRSRSYSRLSHLIQHFDCDRQRTNGQIMRNRQTDDIYTLRQRSNTVEPQFNQVSRIAKQWPPISNAIGVEPIQDDLDLARAEIVSCRRLAKKTTTKTWTVADAKGNIIDEHSTQRWTGEDDGMNRSYDGTGNSWRTVTDVAPNGQTDYYSNRKLYTRNYFVETELRRAK